MEKHDGTIEEEMTRMMDSFLKCIMRDLIELRTRLDVLKVRARIEVKTDKIDLGNNLPRLLKMTTIGDGVHVLIAVVQAQAQLLAARDVIDKKLFDTIRGWASGRKE